MEPITVPWFLTVSDSEWDRLRLAFRILSCYLVNKFSVTGILV